MRKLFILPLFVIFVTGPASNGVEPHRSPESKLIPVSIPMSVKVDTIDTRLQELDRLIKQL